MKNLFLACVIGLLFTSCEIFSKKPKVAFVSTHINFAPFEFQEAVEAYDGKMEVKAFSPSADAAGTLPAFSLTELTEYDLVVFEGLGARISLLKPQIDSLKQHTQVVFIQTPQAESETTEEVQKTLDLYWTNGNIENYKGLISYIGSTLLGLDLPIIQPRVFPAKFYYHPQNKEPMLSLDGYQTWYHGHIGNNLPNISNDPFTVGLVYYQSSYVKKDLEVIDALIQNIEKKGHKAITLLSQGAWQLDSAFMKNDIPLVDVIIYGGMFLDFANPERGISAAKKLNVPLLGGIVNPYKNVEEWEQDSGGAAPEMTDRFYFTEKDGVFESITIGGTTTLKNGQRKSVPIPYQVDWRVDRALAWARLRKADNADKKLVLTFYNEGGGKANVGSDPDAYLNVPASINRLLKEWRREGYSIGDKNIPTDEALVEEMAEFASNVNYWTREELTYRENAATLVRIPEEKYRSWFRDYTEEQQSEVIRKWGEPPGNLMVEEDDEGHKTIIIPMLAFGNILLAPHPSWGLQHNADLIYANDPLPPNHAYIAFYEWMKREYSPDAFFSLFTQLSLMPGKLESPSRHDFAGMLIGNIPHINASPLIAGASAGNKRRANALTIGHSTDIAYAGLSPSYSDILQAIGDYKSATNPSIRKKLLDKICQAAEAEKLDKVLVNALDQPENLYVDELEKYLVDISLQKVPQGSHILGEVPKGGKKSAMIEAMLGEDYTGNEREEKSREFDSLLNLAQLEIMGFMKALNGEYIESGPSGDPVRSPESLPAGRNPFPSNSKNIPTLEAYEIGEKMGAELLIEYEKKHGAGAIPRKVAFILWSSEITHNQGVLEGEILYLMGIRPVWNSKGQVMDVELISEAELGRPRIDVLVTTSGTYRDHFMDKIQMLDKAVTLAAMAEESNNYVRENAIKYQQSLGLRSIGDGSKRIFSTAPSTYSTNIEFAIEDGQSWQNDSTISDLYLDRMSNSYGSEGNSENQKELFKMNIEDVEAAAFGRSSNAHGIMDHPMVASYLGGLNLAVKNRTGKTPDLYINDLSDASAAKTVKLEDFYRRELHSRYFNVNWIKNMKDQGYEGARYMQGFAENLLAWDVTHTAMVTQEDWDEIFDTYVNDKHQLGLEAYFQEHNPVAMENLIGTLQEAGSKGYWTPSENQEKTLSRIIKQLDLTDKVPSVDANKPSSKLAEVKGYKMTEQIRKLVDPEAGNNHTNIAYMWIFLVVGLLILSGWVLDSGR